MNAEPSRRIVAARLQIAAICGLVSRRRSAKTPLLGRRMP